MDIRIYEFPTMKNYNIIRFVFLLKIISGMRLNLRIIGSEILLNADED